MLREKWPYILIVFLLICGGFIYMNYQPAKTNVTLANHVSAKTKTPPVENQNVQKKPDNKEALAADIVVDIKGAVNKPGVYHMAQGERIVDVLEKAGGFTNKADKAQVNLAKKLTDEMMVYVPAIGEKVSENLTATSSGNDTPGNGKININTATEQDLEKIPGIGPSKASAIIEYREKNGPYQKVEDLDKVSGFGEKTVERMKALISIQ